MRGIKVRGRLSPGAVAQVLAAVEAMPLCRKVSLVRYTADRDAAVTLVHGLLSATAARQGQAEGYVVLDLTCKTATASSAGDGSAAKTKHSWTLQRNEGGALAWSAPTDSIVDAVATPRSD